MKKIIAMIAACVLSALTLCGCGEHGEYNEPQPKGATLEIDLTTSYVAEELTMKGMRAGPIAVTEKGIIMTHWKSTSSSRMYLYDPEQQTYTEFQKNQQHTPAYATQLPDGRLCALYNIIVEKKGSETIYDGIQRPLPEMRALTGDCITRGTDVPALNREKLWDFVPVAKVGDKLVAEIGRASCRERV